ncbi:MAG: hypothetical protein IKZ46_17505, partial [Victivallales bacterium]|nr:hypothetical protein [Victivallales bacterium]
MKVAIIGAGSLVFCKTLILDIIQIPGIGQVDFSLMAPTTRHTSCVKNYIDKVLAANPLPVTVSVTTDRREALKDADYVICTFKIGGLRAYEADVDIPLKYGVDQCIGDTLSPGGIFRTLRTLPVMRDVAQDMCELCPNALMLNYVNPMATMCWAVADSGIKVVGLCHGVQTTLDLLAGYAGVPKEEIDYTCAGINHMAWFIKLEHHGKDLYPILRERIEKPEYYANEKVRGEVFRQFGYFMTESTGHLSEYLPYFRKNQHGMDWYCDEPDFGGETAACLKWTRILETKYADADYFEKEPVELPPRSVEYCSYIIEALECNRMFRFNGNIRNNGLIANLPDDCISEVPIFADGAGLHPTYIGNLPSQLAALNNSNVSVQRLSVESALSGDPEAVVWACALDPLTAARHRHHPGRLRRDPPVHPAELPHRPAEQGGEAVPLQRDLPVPDAPELRPQELYRHRPGHPDEAGGGLSEQLLPQGPRDRLPGGLQLRGPLFPGLQARPRGVPPGLP